MTVIADVFEHCVYCETSVPRATTRAVINKSVYSGGDSTGMTVIADVFEHRVLRNFLTPCYQYVPLSTNQFTLEVIAPV
ncbi:hypothetical protein J6590_067804 [Homalodisca vitripennis]|nr:hypothetical protein J6590_067804 [Homalodisca vitripennis]